MATLAATSASNGEWPVFPFTASTFAANFTGDPAEGFRPSGERASPPGFGFQTGSLSGRCLSGRGFPGCTWRGKSVSAGTAVAMRAIEDSTDAMVSEVGAGADIAACALK